MKYKFVRDEARNFVKANVRMWKYPTADVCPQLDILFQDANGGHNEEFISLKSTYIYLIVSGKGKFIIEDRVYPVKEGDVIIIPPGKRFYYTGNTRQYLITTPPWQEGQDKTIRKIDLKTKK